MWIEVCTWKPINDFLIAGAKTGRSAAAVSRANRIARGKHRNRARQKERRREDGAGPLGVHP